MANKTKAELMEEIEVKNKELKGLKEEIKKLERYKQYEDMANEVVAIRDSFVNAGLTKSEAYDMMKTIAQMAYKMY